MLVKPQKGFPGGEKTHTLEDTKCAVSLGKRTLGARRWSEQGKPRVRLPDRGGASGVPRIEGPEQVRLERGFSSTGKTTKVDRTKAPDGKFPRAGVARQSAAGGFGSGVPSRFNRPPDSPE